MNRRPTILVLAAIVAIAFAVPALAESERVAPQLDRQSLSRALAKSQVALRTARMAKRQARQASRSAFDAQDAAAAARIDATAARGEAANVQAQLASTRIVSATEAGVVTSSAPIGSYEAKGGPSVQVVVPSSGLIEVWAQAEIKDEEGGAVGLYEDGQKVPGISDPEFCGDDSALIEMQGGGPGEFEIFATPPVPGFLGCTSAGAPSSVMLSRPPGSHTYELRYSECSCGGEAEFRNRVLRIGPRP